MLNNNRVGVFDYGSGNILSVANALKAIGADHYVGREFSELKKCNRFILPGVGAYADCMEKIRKFGIDEFIISAAEQHAPILGICVGMQIMGTFGTEFGLTSGLSLFDGKVENMKNLGLENNTRLPNIGWRNVIMLDQSYSWLLDNVQNDNRFYFFHSYAYEKNTPNVVSTSNYGNIDYPSVIAKANLIGVQFHPEKSGKNGLQLLTNFMKQDL